MFSQKKLFVIFLLLSFTAIGIGASFLPAEAETIVNATDVQNEVHLPLVGQAPWINPFGYESGVSITDATYQQRVDELGGSWTRINRYISWRELQPVEGGAIDWSLLAEFEAELRVLREMGIKPIVVIDDYPAWATIIPSSCSALRPDKYGDFATFAVALVNRYKTGEFRVKNWELGNEVDVDPSLVPTNSVYGCWGNIKDLDYYGGYQYGEMVEVVGRAIKIADPNARVWLGGLMVATPGSDTDQGNPENFLRGVLRAGAAPYFDVVPYHGHMAYYGHMKDPDSLGVGDWALWGGGAVGKPRFIRSILNKGGVDKPLSIDEVGVGCVETNSFCQPPTAEFYQFQANMSVRYAVRVLSERVESFIWYTLNSPSWRNMGLVYNDKTPRPVFNAYQNLVSQTQSLIYSKMVDLGAGIEAHEFIGGKTRLLIVWTDIDEQKIIQISQTNFQAAYDRDGTPITVDSNFNVSIGFAPIYLVYSR